MQACNYLLIHHIFHHVFNKYLSARTSYLKTDYLPNNVPSGFHTVLFTETAGSLTKAAWFRNTHVQLTYCQNHAHIIPLIQYKNSYPRRCSHESKDLNRHTLVFDRIIHGIILQIPSHLRSEFSYLLSNSIRVNNV